VWIRLKDERVRALSADMILVTFGERLGPRECCLTVQGATSNAGFETAMQHDGENGAVVRVRLEHGSRRKPGLRHVEHRRLVRAKLRASHSDWYRPAAHHEEGLEVLTVSHQV
jgi:hypothetical protein